MPPNAPSITQGFRASSWTDPDSGNIAGHEALDIMAANGTPVLAVAAGVVRVVTSDPLSGRRIIIEHGSGLTGASFTSWYFHLGDQLVKTGERVEQGDVIGRVGASGFLAPYPHLHFELHHGPRAVNPHLYWQAGVGRATCFNVAANTTGSTFQITYPVMCKAAQAFPESEL